MSRKMFGQLVLICATLFGLCETCFAEYLEWKGDATVNAKLPWSIRLHRGENKETLVKASLVTIDLRDRKLALKSLSIPSGTVDTVSNIASEAGAVVAINGGYFGLVDGVNRPFSAIVSDGFIQSNNPHSLMRGEKAYYPTRSMLGIDARGNVEIRWTYEFDGQLFAYFQPNPNRIGHPGDKPVKDNGFLWEPVEAVGAGPRLLLNKAHYVSYNSEVFFGSGISWSKRQPRSAIGHDEKGKLYFLVVDGRQEDSKGVSLYGLANMMRSVGATDAMNLDGGGSSTLVVLGSVVNSPSLGKQRPVTSAVAIVRQD